jgi:hypothetical protein
MRAGERELTRGGRERKMTGIVPWTMISPAVCARVCVEMSMCSLSPNAASLGYPNVKVCKKFWTSLDFRDELLWSCNCVGSFV